MAPTTDAASSGPACWVVALAALILTVIHWPLSCLADAVEYVSNWFVFNDGIRGVLTKTFSFHFNSVDKESPKYRSIVALIDGRTELKETAASHISEQSVISDLTQPLVGGEGRLGAVSYLELTSMASNIAYENEAYIQHVVNNTWKMHFVGFYKCWNKYLMDKGKDAPRTHAFFCMGKVKDAPTTHAFICMDKEEDATLIVVAFRGTNPYNCKDMATDLELFWLRMGDLGNLHMGFLKALGLQDDTDAAKAFPKDTPDMEEEKPFAYYKLREVLRGMVKDNPNAKIILTGHSLGGALAVIFPALLSMNDEADILKALVAVYTYGQPRVGDSTFANYFRTVFPCKLRRMVYRYDIVPRIPFDFPPLALFKHGGKCLYFDGWYKGKILKDDVPNKNYFCLIYAPLMFLSACVDLIMAIVDLIMAIFLWITKGKEYQEGRVSIPNGVLGLFVPGIAFHSMQNYINAGRLSKIASEEED